MIETETWRLTNWPAAYDFLPRSHLHEEDDNDNFAQTEEALACLCSGNELACSLRADAVYWRCHSMCPQFAELWSCGQTSIRTGLPLIFEGGEHQIDSNLVSYGYNLVLNKDGTVLAPTGAPLEGRETLVLVLVYEQDHNAREYAHVVSIMAPIRDAILYHF